MYMGHSNVAMLTEKFYLISDLITICFVAKSNTLKVLLKSRLPFSDFSGYHSIVYMEENYSGKSVTFKNTFCGQQRVSDVVSTDVVFSTAVFVSTAVVVSTAVFVSTTVVVSTAVFVSTAVVVSTAVFVSTAVIVFEAVVFSSAVVILDAVVFSSAVIILEAVEAL